MGSIDIADQLRSYLSTQQAARGNWQPFFDKLVDTAIINGYRLAGTNGSLVSHHVFHSSLITALLTTAQTSLTGSPTCSHSFVFNKLKFKFLYRQCRQFRLHNPTRQSYITNNSLEPKLVGKYAILQEGHIRVYTVRITRRLCL